MQELIGAVGQLSAKERKALAAMLRQKGINLFGIAPVFKRKPDQPLLLSYAQERQWFLWQLDPHSAAYHLSSALMLEGRLDVDALERSFDTLVQRHETLRTRFVEQDGQTLQVIDAHRPFALQRATLPAPLDDAAIRDWVEAQSRCLFDLSQAPLMRVALLDIGEQRQVLVITQHHIVSDGWSMQIMVDELMQLYAGQVQGMPAQLPVLPIQYADYALWQREWMEAGERERQLNYWTARLGGEQPVLELPLDHPRPAVQSFDGAVLGIHLPPPLGQALKQLAQAENVTLFMLLLATFQTLLHRYSGQDDIRVGVPVANRNRVETEGLLGFFVNTQILKADVDGQQGFRTLLAQVRQSVLDAQDHQDLPFEQLVDALQPERTLSHNALFQVMYSHQGREESGWAERQLPGLALRTLDWSTGNAQFDLTLTTYEREDGLDASLTYATDLFEPQTAERLGRHWLNLLQAIVADPSQRIGELPMLDDEERLITLGQWNGSVVSHPSQGTLHGLIERQVERSPQAIAISHVGTSLSYDTLNRRANRLAHRLIEAGVGADVRVGLAVERGPDMLVGLLAILKAGGAYVPLDPGYPADRLAYMIEDSGIALLLAQPTLLTRLPVADDLACEALGEDAGVGYPEHNPGVALDAGNLAYVIYTSGSTGKPKGTLLAHHNVVRLFAATEHWFGFDESDVWTLFHSYAFDFSVWEIFGALLYGGRLVIVPHDTSRSPDAFFDLLVDEQVTVLNQTPSAFSPLMQVACAPAQAPAQLALRHVVFGGEALDVKSLKPWLERFGDRQPRLINMYGITETTVHVTYRPITLADLDGEVGSPIGEVIPDLSWYLLDPSLNPVARGCIGELYIGQAGLARGYLNRGDLTATRFIPDPFGTAGERLYRTGDLARYRADGVIEYIGRIDHQVKIRGFRIELGEIEARLAALPEVSQAVVLAQQAASGAQLVGYVVVQAAGGDTSVVRDTLRRQLREQLPEHMVPAHLMVLDALPLTVNGKLDRRALPQPDASLLQGAYVAPGTELEQRIADLWRDVLKLERVGLTDNFFELGGDSIMSIQMVSRARQAGIRFSPKDLFQHQTVQRLARVAEQGEQTLDEQALALNGPVPLLPMQQLFFDTDIPQRHHWNQSVLLRPARRLDGEYLEAALDAVVAGHDALRLRFVEQDGTWQASISEQASRNLLWQRSCASLEALDQLGEQAQASLDLAGGELLRALLVDLPGGEQRLLLVIHHLAVDGVSWRILFEDLQQAYTALAAQQPVQLPARTHSVKWWAERLQQKADEMAAAQLDYWRGQLEGLSPTLPCDNPGGRLQGDLEQHVSTRLDADTTRALLQEAPAAYRTQVNDLLLAALARVLARWTGHDAVGVLLEGHGREELVEDQDLSRTVGWFTSLFPVRLTALDALGDTLCGVKEQLRAIPDKGIGYGALRYLGNDDARATLAALPLPRVTFNYLGQFDASFDDAGALFTPCGDAAGNPRSGQAPLDNWLSINGQVFKGALELNWTFSGEMFDTATVQRLADDYAEQLRLVIAHCCTQAKGHATPSDFPLAGLDQTQLDALAHQGLELSAVEDLYPLAPMQQGMLFHSLYARDAGDYITQMSLPVTGLDPQRFIAAWQAAVDAHAILRTAFLWQPPLAQPRQAVMRHVEVPWQLLDWRGRQNQSGALVALADGERALGFDLSCAPLLRLVLVRLDEQRYQMIYTHHHILMDGWSNSQLMGEVLQRYCGQAPLGAPGRYADYIGWLQAQDAGRSEAFWRDQVSAFDEPTLLAQAASGDGSGHASLHLELDARDTERLQTFAKACKVTVNTVLQASWLLLLQRYTGQPTVAFGATVAGRPADLRDAEQQIGLFINTLPVIAQPRADLTLGQWLQQVQVQNLGLREFEHTPLFDVQRWAGRAGEALFDTILVFENYPVAEVLQRSAPEGLSFGELEQHEQTNYPLTLSVGMGERLSLHFSHDRAHFGAADMARIGEQLLHLLESLPDAADCRLDHLSLFDEVQRQATLAEWNPAPQRFDSAQCLHQLIEAQATRVPDAIAVSLDGQQLSYAQLNARANQLARALVEQGIGAETLVGLAVERGLEMIVGLLAILKAGGAYVPLDPAYPQDRLAYMIEDSGLQSVLTQQHLQARLPVPVGVRSLLLDGDYSAYGIDNLNLALDPANLAYVIYTSGSTGKPKGALLPHHNVLRLFAATEHWFGFDERDVWTLFHSYAFDFSVWEIFGALLYGGRLVIVPQATSRAPETFFSLLLDEGVTVLNQTPSAFRQLMQVACSPEHTSAQPALRHVVFGGEALDVHGLKPWFDRFGDRQPRLINMYGITETTVHVTYRPITLADLDGDAASPIGEPIPDLSWYLLDADLNPVPKGAVGELHVGQAGLARGYLKRADLSATRFVPDSFSNSGERLYRTGDLARYRQDGLIEYVGRIDHQVKIRGFRIELGEIEARLTQQKAVREAVVLAVDGPSGQQLVGYVIPHQSAQDASALREELKAGLKAHLPDYMVPAHLLFLAQWPLTANGKLDRRALPAPDASLLQQGYVAPATERERQLAAIWAQVLELDQIGRDDHFFELGGHSLLATQVIARVRQTLELDAGLRHLFEAPTLAGFAASLEALDASKARPLPALVAHGEQAEAPLSLAQRRLWVVEQFASPSGAYGMPLALRVEGELSVPLLQASLAQLIQRHEVLRSAYVADDDGDPLACVTREVTLDLPVLDLSGLSAGEREGRVAEAIEANARQPISLLRAPLLRGQVLRLGEHSHVLLFCMHHIISDGWSMALLGNEVVEVYGRLLAGNHTPLPALAVQYSDYARWQLELDRVGVLDAQAAWWRDALVGHDGLLRLPTDQPRQAKASQVGRDLGFTLPEALHQALKALSRDAGVTLYSTLLAGFQLMLHRLSGSDDVLVGADVAGRAQPELEALIGFFINVLPLRSRWQPDLSLRQYLAQVQSTALGAFEHQDLPFDQIVDAVGAPRHKGANPLVQVLFVMNNLPVQPSGFAQLQVEAIPSAGGFSKFDMALFIDEEHGQLHGTWQYASDLFQQERIERCVKAWVTILEQMVSDPDQPLGDIDMPTNTAAQVAAPATPAPSKADKLGKFLKKAPGASARPASATMRESLIVPGQVFPALWEPTDPGLDLVQWIASNRALVEEKLGTHAGILFRGFAIRDIHDFEAFAEAVQPGLYGKYGDLPKKEGGKNTYRSTPYPEKKMILFHNESSHQDRWPRKQMFYCEQPSPIGGATPVVDCRLMYQRLPDALRETFERKGLLYVRTFADKLDVSWQHFFKTEARTEVEARCRAAGIQWTWLDNDELQIRTPCPAIIRHPVTGEKSFFNQVQLHHNHCLDPDVREDLLAMFGEQRMPRHVYYGDGSPIEDEVMQLIGELYEACAVRFDWQKGDVILLDNMLAAHARDPFEGPRKIVVAMGDMIERSALEALYPTLQKDGAGA